MNNNIKLGLLNHSIEAPIIDRRGSGGSYNYIKWGNDNNFSQFLIDLIQSSPLQNSILESLYHKLCGASIDVPANIQNPSLLESWQEFVCKIFKDYTYFEAFAIQCVLNLDGKTFSFYHQPVSEVRLEQVEGNKIQNAFICTDWSKSRPSKVEKIKMFGSETPVKGEKYLMYFKPYSPQEYYYHTPSYFSAANWISADARLSRYYNNFVASNLNSNKIITYPTEVPEDEKVEIYENLRRNFGGEQNAGSFILLFGEGETKPEISNLDSPDADLYNNLTDTVAKYIISANRLTSPILAGISTSSGFSSKSEEIISADVTYRLSVVQPMRSFILSKINGLLKLNNYNIDVISVKDYNLIEEYEGVTENNDKIEEEGLENG